MSLTAEQLCVLALARAGEVTDTVPSPRALLYRRIGVRQQQLAAIAAALAPDYFGASADGVLIGGAADLNDMSPTVPLAELIANVTVKDPGTSPYAVDERINIVREKDAVDAALPPRATIRGGVIRGVGADLDGVASVKVYYASLPDGIAATGANTVIAIPDPHSELLVVDLTRYLLLRANMDATLLQATLGSLDTEEKELLTGWAAHVQGFAPTQERFSARA